MKAVTRENMDTGPVKLGYRPGKRHPDHADDPDRAGVARFGGQVGILVPDSVFSMLHRF
jgi:hypothetical protein